ncbi:MAG: MBL fold metallo-hydrolase [Polyangiaceae bacterium]|jgi:glyoxylase-like metal-dependent hydrolase (beta-lactamase superfamily II)|nr:MBL fold metallo-hydrolase [Polyangiaceae bacterium]
MVEIDALALPIPLRLGLVNVYLIRSDEGCALVDTGVATDDTRRAVCVQLQQHGVSLSQIRQVFITHHHVDHWGLGAWFQELGAEVIMSRIDSDNLHKWFFQPSFERRIIDFYRRYGLPSTALGRVVPALRMLRDLTAKLVPDRLVGDGEVVLLAGEPFRVLSTPGHTIGHACLLHAPSATLIAGDHVLPNITPNISVSIDTAFDPLSAYRRSLAYVRQLECARALPAHGPPINDLVRRVDEILEHHVRREDQVLSFLSEGEATCVQLSQKLFGADALDGWKTWFAVGETLAHLRALETQGRVIEVQRGGQAVFNRTA